LDSYVHDVEGPEGEKGSGPKGLRRCLLLVNKADLLTSDQRWGAKYTSPKHSSHDVSHRRKWADYFEKEGIQFAFFSAANAKALQEAKRLAEEAALDQPQQTEANESEDQSEIDSEDEVVDTIGDLTESHEDESMEEEPPQADVSADIDPHHLPVDASEADDPRTRVLSVLELEELFLSSAPDLSSESCHHVIPVLYQLALAFATSTTPAPSKLVVGLVGYPNVGKSSTINALLGEKKVSVSSTPGKTKHFQTIHLSPAIVLCDCPGLVFPQFATTKAALVCDGVLPIDQMREHIGPIGLVVLRVPRGILEGTYGLRIRRRGTEDGGDGDGEQVTAEDLLVSYASKSSGCPAECELTSLSCSWLCPCRTRLA
jgi:large subunit GTPase 1